MYRSWVYSINPFIAATNYSYRKAKQIADHTLTALANCNSLKKICSELIIEITPQINNYTAAYVKWLKQQEFQQVKKQTVSYLLAQLNNAKIKEWDLNIQNVYNSKTPEYAILSSAKNQLFQQQKTQQIIVAIGELSLAIGNDAALQKVKADIDDFYDALVVAYANEKAADANNDEDIELSRLSLAEGLYGVLGMLMYQFKSTPEAINDFFLLQELKNRQQQSLQLDVKGGETLLAIVKTFDDGDQLKLVNRGNTVLQTALVPGKNDVMPATAFTLRANEEETVAPQTLGAKGNRFLIVKNLSETEKGSYAIELVS